MHKMDILRRRRKESERGGEGETDGEREKMEMDIPPVINNVPVITDIKGPDVERGDLGVPVQVRVHLQHRCFTGESSLSLHTHTQTPQSDWQQRQRVTGKTAGDWQQWVTSN